MRLPDRVTGLFLVGLGAAAAYGGWQLPPVPGQPVGPNVFPLVIGTGLALCGLAIAFGIGHSFEEEEELIPVEGGGSRRHRPESFTACAPCCRRRCCCSTWQWPTGLASSSRRRLIVFVTSTALGARWKLSLPLAVLAPIGIHLIFSKLLRVPLPAGLLPMPW